MGKKAFKGEGIVWLKEQIEVYENLVKLSKFLISSSTSLSPYIIHSATVWLSFAEKASMVEPDKQ